MKGTCSQLRDPMEPLQGETPYWEEVLKTPLKCILIECSFIRRVAGKKKRRTKGSSGPKLSESKREQILLPHDMLIRKTTIHKVLIQLGNVKSSGFQDENLILFLLMTYYYNESSIELRAKSREYSMPNQFSEFNQHSAISIPCFSISLPHKKPTI